LWWRRREGGRGRRCLPAAVLEGITGQGAGGLIVAGSGVSGGSAALAYCAGKRPELLGREVGAWAAREDGGAVYCGCD
jgi:hypothetical protein